jgi:predicted MPP superfamily phosphohydrolase
VRIHLLSDLHLDSGEYPSTLSDESFDVLVIAGDLGRGSRGIEWLKSVTNKPIVVVLGNHDYWNSEGASKNRLDILQEIRDAAASSNIYILENETALITVNNKTVKFIGATLWTNYGANHYYNTPHEGLLRIGQELMNDHKFIFENDKAITSQQLFDIHKKSISYIANELRNPYSDEFDDVVVVTHHHPSLMSLRKHTGIGIDEKLVTDEREWIQRAGEIRRERTSLYKRASYVSDLSSFLKYQCKNNNLRLWLCGHLHQGMDYVDGGVRIVCNPAGFGKTCSKFNTNLVIDTTQNLRALIARVAGYSLPELHKLNAEINEFLGVASAKKMMVKKAISESVALRANQFREIFEIAFSQAAANFVCDSDNELWGKTKKVDIFFVTSKLGSRGIEKIRLVDAVGDLIDNQILAIRFLENLDK